PALANRLAVVHRLQHRQPSRMLLHGSRQRIQITCSCARSECLPSRQGCACGANCGIDISCRSLRHRCQYFSTRRICSFKVAAIRGLLPCAVDEMPEPPFMTIEPAQRLFGILRRRAVLHRYEFFRDAHGLTNSSSVLPLCPLWLKAFNHGAYAIGCLYSAEYLPVA